MSQRLQRWQRLLHVYEQLRDQSFARLCRQVALRESLERQAEGLHRDFCARTLGGGLLQGQDLLAMAESEMQYLRHLDDLKRALSQSQEHERHLRLEWQSREQRCAQLRRLLTRQVAVKQGAALRCEQGVFDEMAGRDLAHG